MIGFLLLVAGREQDGRHGRRCSWDTMPMSYPLPAVAFSSPPPIKPVSFSPSSSIFLTPCSFPMASPPPSSPLSPCIFTSAPRPTFLQVLPLDKFLRKNRGQKRSKRRRRREDSASPYPISCVQAPSAQHEV